MGSNLRARRFGKALFDGLSSKRWKASKNKKKKSSAFMIRSYRTTKYIGKRSRNAQNLCKENYDFSEGL